MALLKIPVEKNTIQELTNYFNTAIGWEKILIKGIKDHNEIVLKAFKECNYYNDAYMFELCIINGKYGLAQDYYDIIINDPTVSLFNIEYNKELEKYFINYIKNNNKYMKVIEKMRIYCDLEEFNIFITSLQ